MSREMRSEQNPVVVHFKDGRLLKGYTEDCTTLKDTFHLTSEKKNVKERPHEIRIADLKAIFFVKTLEGNKDYAEKNRFEEVDTAPARGRKVKVEFSDGEIMRGISLGYGRGRKGFFIIPVDPQSNNERIYVLTESLRDVKLGRAAER